MKKIILNIVFGGVLAILILILVLFLMITSKPALYQETQDYEVLRKDLDRFNEGLSDVLSRISSKEKFVASFFDNEITSFVRLKKIGLDELDFISHPEVHFEKDRIIGMARLKDAPFNPVVTVVCKINYSRDGEVWFTVEEVKAGALPIAKSFVSRIIAKIESKKLSISEKSYRVDSISITKGLIEIRGEGT